MLTPQDNFSGRSQSRYGIAEEVHLTCTMDPSDLTATQAGGLKWYKYSGVGTVSGGSDGMGTYDAGASAGNVNLFLRVESGPCRAYNEDYYKTVVAPSGGYMIRKPGTGIWHVHNTASVGFQGSSYFIPKDVSFTNIETREGTCTGTGTGFYLHLDGRVHRVGPWVDTSDGNITTGCTDGTTDKVQSGSKGPPYSDGTFIWPIPWEYRVGTGGPNDLETATHYQAADSYGKALIQKAGAGPFIKEAGYPNSSY